MKNLEKVAKSSWALHQSIKDSLAKNIVLAVKTGNLKIEKNILEKLLSMIDASADEGYHKGYNHFIKTIDSVFEHQINLEKPNFVKKNNKI